MNQAQIAGFLLTHPKLRRCATHIAYDNGMVDRDHTEGGVVFEMVERAMRHCPSHELDYVEQWLTQCWNDDDLEDICTDTYAWAERHPETPIPMIVNRVLDTMFEEPAPQPQPGNGT